jgi:uncharacterized protein (PEP-CTERM system associated)
VLTATASQGVGSQQEEIGNNLAASNLDIYGQLVDQYNLPTAFANPEFALQNNVYRAYSYRAGATTAVGINRYSLFGFYDRRVSLALVQPPTTSIGANFGWSRMIRPDLTAVLNLGYAKVTNQTLLTSTSTSVSAMTTIPSQNTVNASLGLNYLLARNWTASIIYSLLYQTNGPGSSGAAAAISGNIVTNRLEFLLTKTF